jgi:cytidine deaminase
MHKWDKKVIYMENRHFISGKSAIYTHSNKSVRQTERNARQGFNKSGAARGSGQQNGSAARGSGQQAGSAARGSGREGGFHGVSHERLLAAARTACDLAYVPYSGMSTGAALLGADNMIYTGAAVENAAHAASLCAERAAVAKAVSRGCRDFRALAVAAKSGGMSVPCGICRQVLAEFAPSLTVILEDENGSPVSYKLSDLLPNTFDLKM